MSRYFLDKVKINNHSYGGLNRTAKELTTQAELKLVDFGLFYPTLVLPISVTSPGSRVMMQDVQSIVKIDKAVRFLHQSQLASPAQFRIALIMSGKCSQCSRFTVS